MGYFSVRPVTRPGPPSEGVLVTSSILSQSSGSASRTPPGDARTPTPGARGSEACRDRRRCSATEQPTPPPHRTSGDVRRQLVPEGTQGRVVVGGAGSTHARHLSFGSVP